MYVVNVKTALFCHPPVPWCQPYLRVAPPSSRLGITLPLSSLDHVLELGVGEGAMAWALPGQMLFLRGPGPWSRGSQEEGRSIVRGSKILSCMLLPTEEGEAPPPLQPGKCRREGAQKLLTSFRSPGLYQLYDTPTH